MNRPLQRGFLCQVGLLVALIWTVCAPGAQAASSGLAPITMPADAAMHPQAPNEWWYFTGHLHDAQGRTFGFELVDFKFMDLKKSLPLSPFDTLYRIDLAITDEHTGRFISRVSYLQPTPGKTMLSTSALQIKMVAADESLSIGTVAGATYAYHLTGLLPGGALSLTVRTNRPPLLEGPRGIETIANGYSYYYSLTNLTTTGTLSVAGTHYAVSGLTWMDHQWGQWQWQDDKGWDWMGVQLSNGTSFSLVNFISGKNQTSKFSAISFPNGTETFTEVATMLPLGRYWTSPATHIRYPQGWRIRVPALGLKAQVIPTLPNQEMVDQPGGGMTYWEGSCRLTGTLDGHPISGLTYTELVGYGPKSLFGI
jgi:predicted secreted hydrolase